CDVPVAGVINAADASSLYEIPLVVHDEGLDRFVMDHLRIDAPEPDLTEWRALVDRVFSATKTVRIGLIGKYVSLIDAYLSVVEALNHAGIHHGVNVEVEWIQAEEVEGLLTDRLRALDGIVIPGGFGERGVEGKIAAAGFAREHGIPCLGLCLGMQVMAIEYGRNALGLTGANSLEFDPQTPHPVINLMENQRDVSEKGGTMRLGAYVAQLAPGSKVAESYGEEVVSERHRHRYEFNGKYLSRYDDGDFWACGESPDGRLVEFVELRSHPFWVGTQAHPEFKSRPDRPAPLFRTFIDAALDRKSGRNPQIIQIDSPAASS
ncbi:MAG: CTP synthase, partial [Acidimicrobiales bacterium]